MPVVAFIPARYASSRFPGKALARETGKYLDEHVYERVCQARSVDQVLVLTDDRRIAEACEGFGASWRLTRPEHPSGTDRCAEAAGGLDADVIVNVQGDEPEIEPASIDTLVQALEDDAEADLATLCAPFEPSEDVGDPNVVKVVTDLRGRALYFSRWPIPFERDGRASLALHRKHLGLYAYRREALLALSRLEPSPLELAEKLEQLRALENGLTIAVVEVAHTAVGIDTPQQYAEFVARWRQQA